MLTGVTLCVMGVLFLWHFAALKLLTRPGVSEATRKGAEQGVATSMNLALFFSFLVYPSLASTLFLAFNCVDYEDKSSVIQVDQKIDCRSPEYMKMRLWASCMIPVFVLGIPCWYFFLLYRMKHRINPSPRRSPMAVRKQTRQDAKTLGMITWANIQRKRDPQLKPLAFLWQGYKPKYWWWEVAEMVRKFMIMGIPILIGLALGDSPARGPVLVAYGMLITMLVTLVQSNIDPYLAPPDQQLMLPTHIETFLALLSGMLSDAAQYSTTAQVLRVVPVLLVGVPLTLGLLLAVIFPDRADAWLMQRQQRAMNSLRKSLTGDTGEAGGNSQGQSSGRWRLPWRRGKDKGQASTGSVQGADMVVSAAPPSAAPPPPKAGAQLNPEAWKNVEEVLGKTANKDDLKLVIDQPQEFLAAAVRTQQNADMRAEAERLDAAATDEQQPARQVDNVDGARQINRTLSSRIFV